MPVSFARLPAAIDALLARRPGLLLLVGESRKARTLAVERFAVNLADASIPDNDGKKPQGLALAAEGPPARAVRASVGTAVAAALAEGVPTVASAHAGTFCCNAALYYALGKAEIAGPVVVFVHVPARRRHLRAGEASRGLKAIVRALTT